MYIKFFLLVEIGFVFEFCWIITLLWRKFFISGYTYISFIFFFILNKWMYNSKTRFVELRYCYVPLANWMSKVKLGLTLKLKYEVRSFIQIIQNILLVPILWHDFLRNRYVRSTLTIMAIKCCEPTSSKEKYVTTMGYVDCVQVKNFER